MRQGMKDHLSLEALNKENAALKLTLSNEESLTTKLQDFNNYLQSHNRDLTLRWNESMKQNDILSNQIKNQQVKFDKDIRKEKSKKTINTIFGVGFGAAVGILIGTIFIK